MNILVLNCGTSSVKFQLIDTDCHLPACRSLPLSIVFFWIAVALLYKGYKLHRRKGWQETGETVEEEKR